MSDEQDSWFKSAFGVDLGQMAQDAKEGIGQVANTASQALQSVQGALEGAAENFTGTVTGAVKKVAGAVTGSPSGPASGGGTGSFPLGGSVGRGGKNAPNDVRAVQAALGISADGQCGEGTIAAIVAFQRNMGSAKPDGRVDAGGPTERALAGGARPAATTGATTATPEGDDASGRVGQIQSIAGGLFDSGVSEIQSSLQSAQDSVLTELGASPETVQGIKAAEQAIADFDRGRQAGRAKGSAGLIDMLPPVQLFKAGTRIAEADDAEAEVLKIAEEKAATLAAIGKLGVDPAGSGAEIGEKFGKDAVKARQEGRLAEFAGNLVGQGDVIAATVAVGGAGAGLEAGGARGVAAGVEAGGARGVAAGVEAGGVEAGAVPRTLRGLGEPPPTLRGLGEPIPPTEPGLPPTERGIPPTLRSPVDPLGEPISPLAESVPGSQVGKPVPAEIPPTQRPPVESPIPPTQRSAEPVSPLAESVRPPKGRAQPEAPAEGPPTEVDPAKPQPEPRGPKANVAETPAQAQQNLSDAIAEQQAAEQASSEATQEVLRFRANEPFDPVVAEALEEQAQRASNANADAIFKLKAAQKAARDAAARAKGARGGGGFPPPRR